MRKNISIAVLLIFVLFSASVSAEYGCKACTWVGNENGATVSCMTPPSDMWGSESCRVEGYANDNVGSLMCDDTGNMCYYFEVNG